MSAGPAWPATDVMFAGSLLTWSKYACKQREAPTPDLCTVRARSCARKGCATLLSLLAHAMAQQHRAVTLCLSALHSSEPSTAGSARLSLAEQRRRQSIMLCMLLSKRSSRCATSASRSPLAVCKPSASGASHDDADYESGAGQSCCSECARDPSSSWLGRIRPQLHTESLRAHQGAQSDEAWSAWGIPRTSYAAVSHLGCCDRDYRVCAAVPHAAGSVRHAQVRRTDAVCATAFG